MRAVALAVPTNGSVTTTQAGVPLFSTSTPSCRLHEVQPPQSPTPVMIAWLRAERLSSSSAGATREESDFPTSSHSTP